jgi:hypothetical protein
VRIARGLGRFWYELIIGDDWKIAAAVVVGLTLTCAGLKTGVLSDGWLAVLAGILLIGLFALSLLIDVRAVRARDGDD